MKNDDLQALRDQADTVETVTPAGVPNKPDAVEEDCFDASEYVRQLIQRMGGDDTVASPPPSAQPVPAVRPAPAKPAPPSPPPARRMTRAEEMGVELEPKEAARRQKPEILVDLEKLREAANLTSSSDLHRSDCNSLIRRAYYHLVLSVFCMVLSLVLLGLSTGAFSKAHLSCIILLFMGANFTVRYTTTSKVLWSKMNPSSKRAPVVDG